MSDLIGHPYKPSSERRPTHPPNRAQSEQPSKQRAARPVYRKKRFLIPLGLLLIAAGALSVVSYLAKKAEERRQIVLAERAVFESYLETQEAKYLKIPLMSPRQRSLLRRSRNALHVETAERLGVASVAERDDVLDRAEDVGLVLIDRENPYHWVANLTHSVPYVTPSTAALLDTIGVRFQQKLAEYGLPPYEYHISSALRTQEDQASLRRINVNAARTTSSHEFGTTFDIQFRKYQYDGDPAQELATALPPPTYPFLETEFSARLAAFYNEMEERYRSRLLSLLGETMIELEDEGKLITVMERRQPVFHTTVAERLVPNGLAATD